MTGPVRRRRMALAVVLVGGVLIVGCASSDDSDASSSTTTAGSDDSATTTTAGSDDVTGDACDIVSDDVAADVLGIEIVRREANGEPGSESVSCIKGTERADDPADYFYVSVGVIAGGSALVDQASTELGGQPVDGFGDRAVFSSSAGTLFVADGDDGVQVQVVKAGVPGSQEDCVTVAEDVFARRS